MTTPQEIERCAPSRELVRKFIAMSHEQREAISMQEKTDICLAFQHIDMCVQGRNMPNFCNELWRDLQPLTHFENPQYDNDVALYFEYAKFPIRIDTALEGNPLWYLDV